MLERFDIQHHLYEKGLSRSELHARRPYRIAAAVFGVLTLVAGQLWNSGGSIWAWVFGLSFVAAMYCALRASQRASTSRTLRAASAFLVGVALVIWTYWGFTKLGGRFGILTTPVVLVVTGIGGVLLLVLAARLSRSSRAA